MQNAFIESFNGKFRDECLNQNWFVSLDDARRMIEAWRAGGLQLGAPAQQLGLSNAGRVRGQRRPTGAGGGAGRVSHPGRDTNGLAGNAQCYIMTGPITGGRSLSLPIQNVEIKSLANKIRNEDRQSCIFQSLSYQRSTAVV